MWLREKQLKEKASAFVSPGVEVDSPGLEMRGGPPNGARVVRADRREGRFVAVDRWPEGLRLAS